MTDHHPNYGALLAAIRQLCRVRQADLAKATHKSPALLSKVECGDRTLHVEFFAHICKQLTAMVGIKITVGFVIDLANEKPSPETIGKLLHILRRLAEQP